MRAWVDASLLPDGDYQPQALMAAIPVACAIACGCAAICTIGVVVPCVRDCWGRPDAIGCVKQCVGDTIRELPGWAQVLCGACLLGCAVCLVLLPFRPFPPRSPQPPSRPEPETPSDPPPGTLRPYPTRCHLFDEQEIRRDGQKVGKMCVYRCIRNGRPKHYGTVVGPNEPCPRTIIAPWIPQPSPN